MLKAMASWRVCPCPRLYRALGEITLNRRLVELLRRMEPDPTSLSASEEIMEVIQDAQLMGLKLETQEGAEILGRILHRHLLDLADAFQTGNRDPAERLFEFCGADAPHPGTHRGPEFPLCLDAGPVSRRWRPGRPRTRKPRPWPTSWWP